VATPGFFYALALIEQNRSQPAIRTSKMTTWSQRASVKTEGRTGDV
jgi:hypothetical protein